MQILCSFCKPKSTVLLSAQTETLFVWADEEKAIKQLIPGSLALIGPPNQFITGSHLVILISYINKQFNKQEY